MGRTRHALEKDEHAVSEGLKIDRARDAALLATPYVRKELSPNAREKALYHAHQSRDLPKDTSISKSGRCRHPWFAPSAASDDMLCRVSASSIEAGRDECSTVVPNLVNDNTTS